MSKENIENFIINKLSNLKKDEKTIKDEIIKDTTIIKDLLIDAFNEVEKQTEEETTYEKENIKNRLEIEITDIVDFAQIEDKSEYNGTSVLSISDNKDPEQRLFSIVLSDDDIININSMQDLVRDLLTLDTIKKNKGFKSTITIDSQVVLGVCEDDTLNLIKDTISTLFQYEIEEEWIKTRNNIISIILNDYNKEEVKDIKKIEDKLRKELERKDLQTESEVIIKKQKEIKTNYRKLPLKASREELDFFILNKK